MKRSLARLDCSNGMFLIFRRGIPAQSAADSAKKLFEAGQFKECEALLRAEISKTPGMPRCTTGLGNARLNFMTTIWPTPAPKRPLNYSRRPRGSPSGCGRIWPTGRSNTGPRCFRTRCISSTPWAARGRRAASQAGARSPCACSRCLLGPAAPDRRVGGPLSTALGATALAYFGETGPALDRARLALLRGLEPGAARPYEDFAVKGVGSPAWAAALSVAFLAQDECRAKGRGE